MEFQTGREVDWNKLKETAKEYSENLDFGEEVVSGIQIYSSKEIPKDLNFLFDPYEKDDVRFKEALRSDYGIRFYRDQYHSRAGLLELGEGNKSDEDPLFEGFYSFFLIAQADMEWEGLNVEEGDIIFAHEWNRPVRVMWMDPHKVKRHFLD